MPLITIYSPKGGVGKTTLSANLCYSLASFGLKAIAIDFDPQNSLRLHFGIPLSDGRGFAATAPESAEWSKHVMLKKDGVFLLPYGNVTEKQWLDFEHCVVSDHLFLKRGLSELLSSPGLVVIADLSNASLSLRNAILPLTDLLLVPLLADTASLSLLPDVEKILVQRATQENGIQSYVVINQVDYRRKISKDVEFFIEERLKDKLLGIVHRDESVVEANAVQKSIFEVNSASIAAFDIEVLTKKIVDKLGLQVGHGGVHHSAVPNKR